MKKRHFLFLMVSLLCFTTARAGFFNDNNSHVLRSCFGGIILHNNQLYYTDSKNTTIVSVTTSGNGLSVVPGDTAFIYIPYGNTLTVQGGPGKGTEPGGAAIRVPGNSVLYVLGGGKLIAKGGAAGLGTMGQNGDEGSITSVSVPIPMPVFYEGGAGGAGGNGGGGAGAGIGGNGGRGGYGGKGVESPSLNAVAFKDGFNGIAGNVGGDSDSGEDCGKVYLVGSLDVNAFSGDTCCVFNASPLGCVSKKEGGSLMENFWCVGGGGGGGNGNNGLLASRIGGGGAGASGAGGGASGGCTNYYRLDMEMFAKELAKAVTTALFDALIAAASTNPVSTSLIVVSIFGSEFTLLSEGTLLTSLLSSMLETDFSPVQINGGGGFGSDSDLAPAIGVNGLGFRVSDFEITTIWGHKIKITPQKGGDAGKFGANGSLQRAMRSSQVEVNQDMERLTRENAPAKLRQVLTFDMKFDTTGIVKETRQQDLKIVYSDELPKVRVPESRQGYIFKGYCDNTGRYWYDQNGNPLPTAKDIKGQNVNIYLNPGDVTLYPKWSAYHILVVRHWQEAPFKKQETNDADLNAAGIDTLRYFVKDYDFFMCEPNAGETTAWKTVISRVYDNFKLVGNSSQTIEMTDPSRIYVADFVYDRQTYSLNWALPVGTEILDSVYTEAGMVSFGKTIMAPKYAVNSNTGTFQFLKGWKEKGGQDLVQIDTMPARDIVYEAVMEPVPIPMSFRNDSLYGTYQEPRSKNLGQQILFTVTPKKGYEVDTCRATIFTPYGIRKENVIETQQGQVIPGTLDIDSIAVEIRYKGVAHKLNYREGQGSFRAERLTMYLNRDSVYSGMDRNTLTIRNGNEVWLRPEPNRSFPDIVCRSIAVKTKSGKEVPVEYVENYDRHDKCQYYWKFFAPDEDIDVEATYGFTLSDSKVQTTVGINKPDSCVFNAYSNRGQRLDNQYLLDRNEGYMLTPGQILWFEADSKTKIDSITVDVDGKKYNVEVNGLLFSYRDSLNRDTTMLPYVVRRYVMRLPQSAKKSVHIQLYNGGNNVVTTKKDTEVFVARDPRRDDRYYDTFGNCWGSDWNNIPAGIYIYKGNKVVKNEN